MKVFDGSYNLSSFLQAEKILFDSNLDKEYAPISGTAEFCNLVAQFAFGENSEIIKNGLVCHELVPILTVLYN